MWGIIFFFDFGDVWATKGKKIGGEKLKWNTRSEAEVWAQTNCGSVCYIAVEIQNKEDNNGKQD